MSEHKKSKTEKWTKIFDQWRQSGKSARAYCIENKIVYTTFLGWRKSLEPYQPCLTQLPNTPEKPHFIEIKENEIVSGLYLDYKNVLIHLSPEFDSGVLRRCLYVLRDMPC